MGVNDWLAPRKFDEGRIKMPAWCSTKLIGFRVAGYDVLRIVLGSLLLLAAGLKCYQLGSGPVAESGLLTSRWFLILVVEFELIFALFLLVGACRHLVWTGAVACFAVFACLSCYKAVSGDASCGCFGAARVSPWSTFCLDIVALLALLRLRPVRRQVTGGAHLRTIRTRRVLLATIAVAITAPAGWVMSNPRYDACGRGEITPRSTRIVAMRPRNGWECGFRSWGISKAPSVCPRVIGRSFSTATAAMSAMT